MLNNLNLLLTPISAIISMLASWESHFLACDVDDFKEQVNILTDNTKSEKERAAAAKALRKIANREKPAKRMDDSVQKLFDGFARTFGKQLLSAFDISSLLGEEGIDVSDEESAGEVAFSRFIEDCINGDSSIPEEFSKLYEVMMDSGIKSFDELNIPEMRNRVIDRIGYSAYNRFVGFAGIRYRFMIKKVAKKVGTPDKPSRATQKKDSEASQDVL